MAGGAPRYLNYFFDNVDLEPVKSFAQVRAGGRSPSSPSPFPIPYALARSLAVRAPSTSRPPTGGGPADAQHARATALRTS